jgi:hypothetical protein
MTLKCLVKNCMLKFTWWLYAKAFLVTLRWSLSWWLDVEAFPGDWMLKPFLVTGRWSLSWWLDVEAFPGNWTLKPFLMTLRGSLSWWLKAEVFLVTVRWNLYDDWRLKSFWWLYVEAFMVTVWPSPMVITTMRFPQLQCHGDCWAHGSGVPGDGKDIS